METAKNNVVLLGAAALTGYAIYSIKMNVETQQNPHSNSNEPQDLTHIESPSTNIGLGIGVALLLAIGSCFTLCYCSRKLGDEQLHKLPSRELGSNSSSGLPNEPNRKKTNANSQSQLSESQSSQAPRTNQSNSLNSLQHMLPKNDQCIDSAHNIGDATFINANNPSEHAGFLPHHSSPPQPSFPLRLTSSQNTAFALGTLEEKDGFQGFQPFNDSSATFIPEQVPPNLPSEYLFSRLNSLQCYKKPIQEFLDISESAITQNIYNLCSIKDCVSLYLSTTLSKTLSKRSSAFLSKRLNTAIPKEIQDFANQFNNLETRRDKEVFLGTAVLFIKHANVEAQTEFFKNLKDQLTYDIVRNLIVKLPADITHLSLPCLYDKHLELIASNCKNLKYLKISGEPITFRKLGEDSYTISKIGISEISSLPVLEHLDISGCDNDKSHNNRIKELEISFKLCRESNPQASLFTRTKTVPLHKHSKGYRVEHAGLVTLL